MPMMKQLKRKAVIEQLQKLCINDIEGQPLENVLYSTMLKILARKRAEQH